MTFWIATGAKINLGLHILGKRPDGYHDIETIFVPISWSDKVSASPADEFGFSCSDADLPDDGSNLCVAAKLAFENRFGRIAPVALRLDKRVPYGAGLGGGSANAAGTLRLLAHINGIDDDAELVDLARGIGADVPFFLGHETSRGVGRGDILDAVTSPDGNPYVLPFTIVIAVPELEISTAAAYAGVIPNGDDRVDLVSMVVSNDLSVWRRHLVNDFERFLASAFPQLATIKGSLSGLGADYASVTGTGSAVYGLFSDPARARDAEAELARRQIRTWIGRASTARPEIMTSTA